MSVSPDFFHFQIEGWWSRPSIAALSRPSRKLMLYPEESDVLFLWLFRENRFIWIYGVDVVRGKYNELKKAPSIFIPLLRTVIISISLARRRVITDVIENKVHPLLQTNLCRTLSQIDGRLNSISDIEINAFTGLVALLSRCIRRAELWISWR